MSAAVVHGLLGLILTTLGVIVFGLAVGVALGLLWSVYAAIWDARALHRTFLKPSTPDSGKPLIIGWTPVEDTRTQWERDRDDALADLNREFDA